MRELTSIEIIEDNAGYNNTLGLSWIDPETGDRKGVVVTWNSDDTAGDRIEDDAIGIPDELAAQIDWDSAEFFIIPDGGDRNRRLERKLGDLAEGDAEVFTIHNADDAANRRVKFENESTRDGGKHVGSAQGFDILFQSEQKNPNRPGLDENDPNSSDYTLGDTDGTGDPNVNKAPGNETDVSGGLDGAGFTAGDNQSVIGFEDLVRRSDNDFNDLIIRVTFADDDDTGGGDPVNDGQDGSDDIVTWSPSDGSGDSDGGSGFDVFAVALGSATTAIAIEAQDSTISLMAGGETVEIANYEEIEVQLGEGDDTATVDGDFSGTGLSQDTIIIFGGNGNDLIDASGVTGQNLEIFGQNGQDRLFGGDGDDLLDGGNGVDTLDGGAGDDTLFGANGADILTGGSGTNQMAGGNGGDLFVFAGGTDVIADFDVAEGDLLDLAALGIDAALIASLPTDNDPVAIRDALLNGIVNNDGDFVRVEFSFDFLEHVFGRGPGNDQDTGDTTDDLTMTFFDASGNELGSISLLGVDTLDEFSSVFLDGISN